MPDIDYHDLTAIQDTLKIVYGKGITNQFVDEKTTYNLFPKSERKPKGLGYEFAIRYARAQGIGARRESEVLPDPLAGKYDKGQIKPKYVYGVLRMTGPAIEAAKGDIAAFVDGLADSVADIYDALIVDLNRQACADGFGLLGTLSLASDAVTTSGTTTWTVTMNNDLSVQRLIEGMVVDFYDGANIDQSSVASRIKSVDPVTKSAEMEPNEGTYKANHPIVAARAYTITTDPVPDAAYMVRVGAREVTHATSNVPVEMTGIEGIYDDGTLLATYENITVADFPAWRANLLTNSAVARELTLDLMLQALDVSRTRSGKTIQTMRMGLGQRRKYANLLLPDVRFQPGELEGGYEKLTFAGGDGSVKMVIDPALPPAKIFCEPNGVIQKYEMTPLGWGNLDQQIHQRQGYDEWDQFLRIYTNLGSEHRNCLTLIGDLVEPSLFT
jgi:hypothetical protein